MKNLELKAQLFDYVGEIYEAACNPGHWDSALKELCRIVGAKSAGIFVRDIKFNRTVVLASFGIPALVRHSYDLGLGKYDPVFNLMARENSGKCSSLFNDEQIGNRYPSFSKLLMKPAGFTYLAGMEILNDQDWVCGLGIHRLPQHGVFTEPEMEQISLLHPHFLRAVKIQKAFHRLEIGHKNLESALTSITLGIILADTAGRVTYINPAAERLLAAHKALTVSPRLKAYLDTENVEFQRCFREVASSPGTDGGAVRALALTHPLRSDYLTVSMIQKDIKDTIFGQSSHYIVLYLGGNGLQESVTADLLKSAFKTTKAEAKVAIGLANGLSPQEIAQRTKVSVNTIRTQLKKVFEKTSTKGQADLVRLMLSGSFNIQE